jgi:hypothetical protein
MMSFKILADVLMAMFAMCHLVRMAFGNGKSQGNGQKSHTEGVE